MHLHSRRSPSGPSAPEESLLPIAASSDLATISSAGPSLGSSVARRACLAAILSSCCGLAACSTPPPALSRAEALDEYRRAASSWLVRDEPHHVERLRRPPDAGPQVDLPRITAHVAGEPLRALAELLVLESGVALSFPAEFAEVPVYVAWDDRDALPALSALADQLGLVAIARGVREVELAPERASDVDVAALSAVYDDPLQVQAVAARLISSVGGASVVGNAVVVTDTPDRLAKIERLAEVLSAERSQWLVEAQFIEVSSSWERRLGAELRAAGTLTATFSASDILAPTRGGALLVELLAEASIGSADARTLATSRLYCLDGRSARSDFGQRTPVPVRSVSSEGTVSTLRYEQVETGVILQVAVRELPTGAAMFSLAPEVSAVTGFVDEAPIISQSRVQVDAILESGGVLVVGGLETLDASDALGGGGGLALGARSRSQSASRSVVVVIRAQRVRAAGPSGGGRSLASPETHYRTGGEGSGISPENSSHGLTATDDM